MFPLAYLGVVIIAGILSACNSEEKKFEEGPPITPEPPPRPEPPTLAVSKDEPAYGVYLKLLEAGVRPENMDQVGKKDRGVEKGDGQIKEEDLFFVGSTFYKNRSDLSVDETKRWNEEIQTSFKDASDRYFSRGAEQNGLIFPEACQDLTFYKKATFWNKNNEQAQFYLGVCQSDPKHLHQVLRINPGNTQAKEALENISGAAPKKFPKDATTTSPKNTRRR